MKLVVALAAVAGVAVLASVPGAGAQDNLPACSYTSSRLAPVKVSKLPARSVANRHQIVRIKPRGKNGKLLNTKITAMGITFERISDGGIADTENILADYKKAKPNSTIGFDVQLGTFSPGERAIVRWTDNDPGQPTHPCQGEARTGDMKIVSADSAQKPVVGSKDGQSDARKGDSGLLTVGGKGTGCPLTTADKVSVVATSAGVKKTLKLDMACGFWSSKLVVRVDRFTLLSEDGGYIGAARVYVSPRASPTPGARLSLAVKVGSKTISTKKFRVADNGAVVRG